MKKTKKKVNILKLAFIVAGAVALVAAISTLVAVLKKKAEEEKRREAEIEDEIRTILEEKLSCVEAISEETDSVEGEEE